MQTAPPGHPALEGVSACAGAALTPAAMRTAAATAGTERNFIVSPDLSRARPDGRASLSIGLDGRGGDLVWMGEGRVPTPRMLADRAGAGYLGGRRYPSSRRPAICGTERLQRKLDVADLGTLA